MEPPGARLDIHDLGLLPGKVSNVIDPEITQIIRTFPSKNHQIGVFEFSNMVGSFPRSCLRLKRGNLNPVHRSQVQRADSVVPMFVGPSASEEQKLIINWIVIEGAIGPFLR